MVVVSTSAVVVVVDDDVVDGAPMVVVRAPAPLEHAATTTSRATYPEQMFGPLNGVRVALVCFAIVAAIAGLIAGYPLVTVVLLAGVALHGLGWLYLYRQHLRRSSN
jgi:hypothetical protein